MTRPTQGLIVSQEQELGASEQAERLIVQEQIQAVPGRRLPKGLRPIKAPGLSLPVACAGGACLLRDQLRQIAQKCKGDKACLLSEISRIQTESKASQEAAPFVAAQQMTTSQLPGTT